MFIKFIWNLQNAMKSLQDMLAHSKRALLDVATATSEE